MVPVEAAGALAPAARAMQVQEVLATQEAMDQQVIMEVRIASVMEMLVEALVVNMAIVIRIIIHSNSPMRSSNISRNYSNSSRHNSSTTNKSKP